MTCFAQTASIKVKSYAQRFSSFAPHYLKKKKKSASLTSAFCFQADTIPLRFDASHQHHSFSYVKCAIRKGLECLETGRGCAQAIPAA